MSTEPSNDTENNIPKTDCSGVFSMQTSSCSSSDSHVTARTKYILKQDEEYYDIFERGRQSSEAFRVKHQYNPAAQDDFLAMPYEYNYFEDLEIESNRKYGDMVKRNPEGMRLQSDHIGEETFEYLEKFAEQHPDILPPSCLSKDARVVDMGCGTAGALRASKATEKAGFDIDEEQLIFARQWGKEVSDSGKIFQADLSEVTRENIGFGNADFMHWASPPVVFSRDPDQETFDLMEGVIRGAHASMNLDNPDARAFMGMPLNAVDMKKLFTGEESEIPKRYVPFVKSLNKYFEIIDIGDATEQEPLTQGRLIGDAFAFGMILKPRSEEDIKKIEQGERLQEAAKQFENLYSTS